MCQQVIQFCSGSTRPLLFAGSLLSFLLALAIGYVGYSTNALYSDIDAQIAEKRSLCYFLQLIAAAYLLVVTVFSCYTAHYDQKHSIRVLSCVTTLNFVLALVALFMAPKGQELSHLFEDTLKQAAENYNWTDASGVPPPPPPPLNESEGVPGNLVLPSVANKTNERVARWAGNDNQRPDKQKMSVENATRIWDNLQRRGCCGIENATEWPKVPNSKGIPKSCCSNPVHIENFYQCKEPDQGHKQACMELIGSTGLNLYIVLGLIAFVNFYLAIISGISAYKTYSYSEASQNAYT